MSRELVLVTGASSELGRDLIARLTTPGNPERVVLAHYFMNANALPSNRQVVPLQADFGEPGAARRMADSILADFGAPDKIVHLPAERLRYERFAKFDSAHFERDFAIQFASIVTLLSAFLPVCVQARRKLTGEGNAKVAFVLSSVVIGAPPKYMAMYTAVKYALLGLMRSLAAEYSGSRVNINAVSPSMMETQLLASIPVKAIELSAAANPTGRNAATGDVAPAIEFLLSPQSDYINGANIPVTGGAAF